MRRRERAVEGVERIEAVIARCDCCRLALADADAPYIVPLNFGYRRAGETSYFYFHSAAEGRKIDLIRQGRKAGFELDTGHALLPQDRACGYSFRYQSVVGTGTLALLTDAAEKAAALRLIMAHYTGKDDWSFEENALRAVAVIALRVEEMACKERP